MEPDAKATDELLGTICHDLKEPLSSIVMGSSFLLRELPHDAQSNANERARRMAEAILRAAHRMSRLLSDYHELSRFERGVASLDLAEQDAAELISAAIEPFRAAARAAGIALIIGDAMERVRCDRERIVDALGKLVSNALRATPSGGRVTLSAVAKENAVELRVRDTGGGVASDVLPHLFDYHWLVTRRARNGAGIGLALTQRIAQAHGGDVRVETAPARGSVFTILLPMANGAAH